MPTITEGSTNVYADLGYPDAIEMQRKASLVAKIGQAIDTQCLSLEAAADCLGIDQANLLKIIHGNFRDVGEVELLQMFAKLSGPLVQEAVARMLAAPRFLSQEAFDSFAEYEMNGGPVVSGDPRGVLPSKSMRRHVKK